MVGKSIPITEMTAPAQRGKTVADHLRALLARVGDVERGLQALEERQASEREELLARLEALESSAGAAGVSPTSSPVESVDREVLAQVVDLENRLKQLERENKELSSVCSQLRQQNEEIANLYVAKHRLHASLDATEIMGIIEEILVELVGAEQFAILFLEKKKNILRRVAGRNAPKTLDSVSFGEGLVGKVAEAGKPYYSETGSTDTPLAIIPLRAQESTVGVIVVYRLLAHKTTFTPVEHQLLELVAEHAPTALMSARLHRLSQKKS
jgi:hypothetical protein